MPIRQHVKEMIPVNVTPYRFAKDAGLPLNTIYRLNDPYYQIAHSTLVRICKALKCQPGDVLTYEPSDDD